MNSVLGLVFLLNLSLLVLSNPLGETSNELKREGEKFVESNLKEFKQKSSTFFSLKQYLYELDSFISKINFNQLNNDIKEITENFEVQVNSQGPHQYSWNEINRAIGSFTEESSNAFYRLSYGIQWIQERLPFVQVNENKKLVFNELDKIQKEFRDIMTSIETSQGIITPFITKIKEFESDIKVEKAVEIVNNVKKLKNIVSDEVFTLKIEKIHVTLEAVMNIEDFINFFNLNKQN